MRWKIIAVNSIIVLLVGVLSYALLRARLGDLASNPAQLKSDAERALAAANSKLELDAVRTERWLATMANEKATREVFKAGTVSARQEEATEYSNRLLSAAVESPVFDQMAPTLVAVVDANGVSLGRNGTNLGRGEDLGAAHPSLKAAAAQGVTASDVWADAKSSELMSVSYAPVRDDDRKVLGARHPRHAAQRRAPPAHQRGTERSRADPRHPGRGKRRPQSQVARRRAALLSAVRQTPVKDAALATVTTGHAAFSQAARPTYLLTAAPLSGYGDGKRAVLVAVSPVESHRERQRPALAGASPSPALGILWSAWVVSARQLHLAPDRGSRRRSPRHPQRQDRSPLRNRARRARRPRVPPQFAVEPAHGRPRRRHRRRGPPVAPPAASDFSTPRGRRATVTAANVDAGRRCGAQGGARRRVLRRLFREYIAAKRSLGDPIDHITEAQLRRPNSVERKRHARKARQARALPRRNSRPRSHSHRRSAQLRTTTFPKAA